ncbi:DUF6221 family protein [Streptomyces mirabilis]|uniref:DUF6221 family protein n=1 Tax=Streptomyces mirabilis TaxID=68239 RepID=UPI003677C784
MELVDFLRARLDEDEAAARAVPADLGHSWSDPGPWVMAGSGGGGREAEVAKAADALEMPLAEAVAHHIARHDPARVLAEVEAKRRIVDLTAGMLSAAKGDSEVDHYGGLSAAEDTLRLLARPFRDHPDFDPSWLED